MLSRAEFDVGVTRSVCTQLNHVMLQFRLVLIHVLSSVRPCLSCPGIANRINLPEVLLPKLATYKLNRILFEPYNEDQLVSIITARCARNAKGPKGADGDEIVQSVFHPAAAMLCARKVSQKSAGDARKALELASVAVGASLFPPLADAVCLVLSLLEM